MLRCGHEMLGYQAHGIPLPCTWERDVVSSEPRPSAPIMSPNGIATASAWARSHHSGLANHESTGLTQ